MKKQSVLQKTRVYVQKVLRGDSSGHDFSHTERVAKLALHIAQIEGKGDVFIIELAALLHDISDWKFAGGDENAGPKKAEEWLLSLSVPDDIMRSVATIIREVSFKGAGVPTKPGSPEGMIVQDADRLDAMGAIGIARAFAFGGKTERAMHTPSIRPKLHASFLEYKKSKSSTINHFYEKLLLLRPLMNTKTAKKIAGKRHIILKNYLQEFMNEWNMKA